MMPEPDLCDLQELDLYSLPDLYNLPDLYTLPDFTI
jgi:hypothetical protein